MEFTRVKILNVLWIWGSLGVQMGTRFVTTEECDASDIFKQTYIEAKQEDIQIIKSPVGMPGRAIFSKFIQKGEGRAETAQNVYVQVYQNV